MDYPYLTCMKCNTDIAEIDLPVPSSQVYPKCPVCKTNDNVDIAIGDEEDSVTETVLLQLMIDKKQGVI